MKIFVFRSRNKVSVLLAGRNAKKQLYLQAKNVVFKNSHNALVSTEM